MEKTKLIINKLHISKYGLDLVKLIHIANSKLESRGNELFLIYPVPFEPGDYLSFYYADGAYTYII